MSINMKKIRKTHGLTQDEVAELLGISKSFLTKIECGTRSPTIKLAREIANLYGVTTIDELLQVS